MNTSRDPAVPEFPLDLLNPTMQLIIRNLSKTYPNGTQALKDVSLDVPQGMFGLLGRNGAGKSTLMRIIATLQDSDAGSIHFGDIDVLCEKGEVRKTLGYLPQAFGFHPRVSAERLLEHFAVLKGLVEPGPRRDVVESLLRRTNLWEVRRQRVGTFSGGMRQRLGVAVALLANPKLIIVDEPVTIAEADAVGPNRLAAYVQPLLLLLLPNLVLVGAILFTIGALARQTIPVYLGAIGIFISYMVAANYWTGIESPMLSTLADPLGINALLAMTRYWTPVELQTRLLGFPAMLLWNRVLWLAVAAGVLAVLHRGFRFAHTDGGGRRRKGRRVTAEAPAAGRWAGAVPQIAGVFGLRTRVRQTLAVARQSLAEVMSGRAFQVAFVGAIGLVLLWGWNLGDTAFDTQRP